VVQCPDQLDGLPDKVRTADKRQIRRIGRTANLDAISSRAIAQNHSQPIVGAYRMKALAKYPSKAGI
jgi:hypothetical protein